MNISSLRFIQMFIIGALTLVAPAAEAHKILVFAYETNGFVVAEAKFSSGRPAQKVEITVLSETEETLHTGLTDKMGVYQFSTRHLGEKNSGDLTIRVDDGMGHIGTWLLEEAEYLNRGAEHQHVLDNNPVTSPPISEKEKLEVDTQLDHQTIEQIVARTVSKTVAREIAPLKQTIAEQKHKSTTLQDILGGLGYIFGLAGIAAYYKSKK